MMGQRLIVLCHEEVKRQVGKASIGIDIFRKGYYKIQKKIGIDNKTTQ